MQCCLNGMYFNEVPKFIAEGPSVFTHVIESRDLFDAAHPLIIPLCLSRVTSYFDVYPNMAEYENGRDP